MPSRILDFRGQPALHFAMPEGDAITVALHGAHLLSWTTADGRERIYLSPDAVFDGRAAIRGGVPICCPQFNQRGTLPKHGFMRNLTWNLAGHDASSVSFALHDNEATRALWPHAFAARLELQLALGSLRIALALTNAGDAPWSFAAALHSYLYVDDIGAARLEGLQGAARWDALRDERQIEASAALQFDGEFDSVYRAPPQPLRLVQPSGALEIAQSDSCTETVVWNPGAALAARLADMPDDGFRHMLCVEAARIDEPVTLAPGASWQGWQQLTVI